MTDSNILASAATSASYNMVLQLMMRLLTFVLNAVILRVISRDLLGIVNVRLMLLYTTSLFVSREAFRRACLSSDLQKPWRQVVNFLWCIIPIGVICSCTLGAVWAYYLEQPDPQSIPYYQLAVLCFVASIIIELLAEPLYICGQMLLFVRAKVLIEGLSLMVRCILSVVLIITFPDIGLLAFSMAQLAQTISYTAMYYGYFMYLQRQKGKDFPFHKVTDLFPQRTPGKPWFSFSLASLTWSFFKQSFLKQILTEGERFVMTLFDVLSFGDQGVYDVINNLGSLVARFIFLPLEDSGYLFFSQTLKRGLSATEQSKDSIALATNVFQYLLKVVTIIGLIIITFGYSYSHLVLDLYGGEVLSTGTGPTLLRCYCVYVLLLAVNGITECFAFATMGKHDIDRYNHKMLIFSAILLLSSWYLTGPLGSAGFILANCINMAARISHSLYYINEFYKESSYKPLKKALPNPTLLAIFMFSMAITAFSEKSFCCSRGWGYRLVHIIVGAVCGLVVLATTYFSEYNLILFIKLHYRARRKASTDSEDNAKLPADTKKDL